MKTTGQHIKAILPKGIKGHLRKLTLKIAVYYPEHERRTESEEFRKTKYRLIEIEDRGCFICGSKEKREVHHFYIEWALKDAVDFEQFKRDYPQFKKYKTVDDFVDSVDNMMVLCQIHHRHKDKGIHCMDYPEWRIQKYLKEGYVYSPEKIINN